MTPEEKAAWAERMWKETQRNDRQARRAAKRVGLAMRKTRPPFECYEVFDPWSGAYVASFGMPWDVVSFCEDLKKKVGTW